ncbi:hypothetical protein MLD38_003083 [Melastoma candidum]|nr:hypothetical protein MLD38_003083 [Melastoma candidum]
MADSKNDDKRQPQWFIEPDNTGSVLIPGIGRIMVPPQFQHHHHYKFPYYGSSGGGGSSGGYSGSSGGSYGGSSGGSTGRSYVPGGDDTLVPNPGIEVPNP